MTDRAPPHVTISHLSRRGLLRGAGLPGAATVLRVPDLADPAEFAAEPGSQATKTASTLIGSYVYVDNDCGVTRCTRSRWTPHGPDDARARHRPHNDDPRLRRPQLLHQRRRYDGAQNTNARIPLTREWHDD